MAKLADAIHFDYIEELCDEVLNRLETDEDTWVSVVGTYDGIRAFIKEFMEYDEVEFDSLVIKDPEYNDYYDEYVVDIWNNDGKILFGCEPAKRDGRYLNCEGNVLYLLDDVKQSVLNTCEYDEMYFVIIGEDEDYCEDCDNCTCCNDKLYVLKVKLDLDTEDAEKIIRKYHNDFYKEIAIFKELLDF